MNRGQLSVVSKQCLHGPFVIAAFVLLLLSFSICMAQDQQPPVPERDAHGAGQSELIPEAEIVSLEQALQEGAGQGVTLTASRRTFKNAVRKGFALIKEAPEAANRVRVLSIIFQCQKRLLALDNSEQNRAALFEISEELVKAPDEYAEARLEAELMLSEKELSGKNATLEERANALADLIERYRGTLAEAKSLLMGALIVQKLDAPELEGEILYALDERFADDHEVIEFRRQFLKISRLDLVFSGTHTTMDGRSLVFPSDTMGHMSLMVFWSKHKSGIVKYLDMMKEGVKKAPGRIDVFSFNVDELPDGGASFLREHGLDWTVMELPGGRQNQTYRSYAQGDPVAVLVNEYGISVARPEIVHGLASTIESSRISDDRYMAQLQSLFIGDSLAGSGEGRVAGGPTSPRLRRTSKWPDVAKATSDKQVAGGGGSDTALDIESKMAAIDDCFIPPPFRYRLTREEALANYEKAEKLCDEVIKHNPNAPELWLLRNRRIIALLGVWNLGFDPGCLLKAVAEAETALASKLPAGADVIPRFCLAKAAMREDHVKTESVVRSFLKDCGGDNVSAPALSAAIILALEARSRALYEEYRSVFLDKYADNAELYSFTAFLRDRHHQYRLLKANHTLRERRARGYIAAHGYPSPTNSLPDIELRKLDGTKFSLPKETNGKLTYLLFVEPPPGATNDFPEVLDSRGKPTRNDHVRMVMGFADRLTKSHINNDINFIAAFLTDDAARVRYLVETNGWSCQAVMVPGGLKNPMVRQLGILSADRLPNVFLLRRDGTVAWSASGLEYKNEFGFPFAMLLGMKVQVEVCEVETAYEALAKGDYREAARIFAGPFPPGEPDRYGWRSPRYHGKALAHIGLKEWEAALDSIDKAVDAHKLLHFRGSRRRSAADWQQDAATVVMNEPCDILLKLWEAKAMILDQLDRKEEAGSLRKMCEEPVKPDRPNIYGDFHERLTALRDSKK